MWTFKSPPQTVCMNSAGKTQRNGNDIHEVLRSPFRAPNDKIAYRVTADNSISLYTSEIFVKYYYVYCKQPKAIVLESLPYSLSVQGVSAAQSSELPYDTILRVVDVAAHLIYRDKAKFATKQPEAKT